MAKKNTLKATPVKPTKMYIFEVAVSDNSKVDRVEVTGSHVESDIDTLRVFKKDELIGEFRDWLYYIRIDEVADEDVLVKNCKSSADKLPPDWGKIDGKKF